MKKFLLLLLTTALYLSNTVAQDNKNYKNYLKEYKNRCNQVLEYFSRNEKELNHNRGALIALSKINQKQDIPTALKIIDRLTEKPTGDMFWFYPMTALYMYSKDKLPPEYKAKIRKAFSFYTPNRGDTENHWIMYYTSLYLISQEFPGETGDTWFNGRSSDENFKDADTYLKEWMKITTTVGQGEFDSPNYADLYAASLVMLYQFAKDPIMKKKAEIMLNWILADFFIDYFDAIYAGANSRIYERSILTKRYDLMSKLGVFLIGDRPLRDKDEKYSYFLENQVLFALSDYRVPEYVLNLAVNREEPYESKEMKRSRNRIRYFEEKNPKVAKYTYMTKDYAMGCVRYGKTEQILQHSWNLNWKAEKSGEMTTLFSVQPFYSEYDMSSLFPESRKMIVGNIVSAKTDYDKEDKLVGASPAEKLFQFKSSLIALYDLSAPEIKYKHYDLIIPKSVKSMTEDPSGWIFLEVNKVFIAIFPLKPYNIVEDSLIYRLRSTDLKNGFVLQVKSSDEFGSFDDFKSKILNLELNLMRFESDHFISMSDIDGNKLEFDFSGKGIVNGFVDDPLTYKLFDNPFMQSDVGSELLTIRYNDKKVLLDSRNAKIIIK